MSFLKETIVVLLICIFALLSVGGSVVALATFMADGASTLDSNECSYYNDRKQN